jgi:uncharacterized protein
MSAARRVDLAVIPAQRWKNGAGLTREIAVWPPGSGVDDFDWRLSVAELERAAPFSTFEGVDRCILVLDGAGMQLLDDKGAPVMTLQPLEPWSFEGERLLQASLPQGPCRDFNVMTRRGRWRAALDVLRHDTPVEAADATLLLALSGRWRAAGQAIDPMQGLLWESPHPPTMTEPLDAHSALLRVRLCHDRRP